MNAGATIICIDNKRVAKKLTVGKEYTVIVAGDIWIGDGLKPAVNVKCDDNVDRWYATTRFKEKSGG
jgi:hypothetical protein